MKRHFLQLLSSVLLSSPLLLFILHIVFLLLSSTLFIPPLHLICLPLLFLFFFRLFLLLLQCAFCLYLKFFPSYTSLPLPLPLRVLLQKFFLLFFLLSHAACFLCSFVILILLPSSLLDSSFSVLLVHSHAGSLVFFSSHSFSVSTTLLLGPPTIPFFSFVLSLVYLLLFAIHFLLFFFFSISSSRCSFLSVLLSLQF